MAVILGPKQKGFSLGNIKIKEDIIRTGN